MERSNKKAKVTAAADAAASEAPVDSDPWVAGEGPGVSAPRPRTQTGGALFGASGGALPQCVVACVLDCLTLTDVARLTVVGACAQAELTRYYAATTTLVVGSAKELAGAARLYERGGSGGSGEGEVKGEPPLPVRVCARLRKLVVRNGSACGVSGRWNRASLRRQVASDARSVVALLERNSRTLTSLHMTDSLSASVSLALRECRSLVAIHAPMALSDMLGDGRGPERWPQLRVATGVGTQGMRTLCDSVGLALTHVGPLHVDWCFEVLAVVSHPLRVLQCTMDEKRNMLRALHAPPTDGCAAAAEELLRTADAEEPALKQWADEDDEENGEAPAADPRAYAAKVPAAALAARLRAFHASLTALDLGCESEAEAPAPPDGSVELPAGVWRLRAHGDVLRYFSGARGLRALSAHVRRPPAAAALERVLRSLRKPAEFALLQLDYHGSTGLGEFALLQQDYLGMSDADKDGGADSPRPPHAATTLVAAAALTPALRTLDVDVADSERADCVSRLAAADAWPALRSFHIGASYPHSGAATILGATEVAVALRAWPALGCLGAADARGCRSAHYFDAEHRDEWLAEPDLEACVAGYRGACSRCDETLLPCPPGAGVAAAASASGPGGRLERLQCSVDPQALADPLSALPGPLWTWPLPALTTLQLCIAPATEGQRWAALSRIMANASLVESLTLVFAEAADPAHGAVAPEGLAGPEEKKEGAEAIHAPALRFLTLRGGWCATARRLLLSLPALQKLRLEFADRDGRAQADLARMGAQLPADTSHWWP